MSLTLNDAPPGDYIVEYLVHDVVKHAEASVSQPSPSSPNNSDQCSAADFFCGTAFEGNAV